MRSFTLTILAILCATMLFAQSSPAVKGRVVDAVTGKAIEYADVIITDAQNNTIASAWVRDGVFSIDRVRDGEYVLTVMLVGYQPFMSDPIAFGNGKSIDMGTISLAMAETGLEEVVVTGEKSKIIYKLDRQTISGSSTLAASGGTAADVLRTSPSIRVDADGGVSFRGSSGFLVYVDGKESPLSLQQIPASNIADIEIITTPSARYKTEGDAGIINIITKRLTTDGFSGSFNAAGSTIGTWNADVLLNYRKGASRWYIGGAGSEIRGNSDFDQTKIITVDGDETKSVADGTRMSINASYIGRAGWELDKNNHKLLVEFQAGVLKTTRGGDMLYDDYRKLNGATEYEVNSYNSKDRYELERHLTQISTDYVWKLNERGDNFSIVGRLRYDGYSLEYTESNMFDFSGVRHEGTRGYEKEHHWDFDGTANYNINYRENGKLDIGYQYTSYSEHGDYTFREWDNNKQAFFNRDDLYAPFFYRRQIHSAYAMLTDQFGSVAVEAGVRADHTIDHMDIEVQNPNNRYRYIKRTELFPSAHISYAAPGNNVISAGYSYRTSRPGIWQLEPYITYEDYYTMKTGNPDINPEYIHSAEIGYRKTIAEEHTISFTGYYRHRKGVRETIRVAHKPGVTLDSLINAGNDRTWGIEMNAHVKATRWWSMTINASLFDYMFTADYEGCTSAANTGYTAMMMNNFTLGKTTRLQFDANVVGPTVLTQGREDAYCYFDLALRQQLFKNKVSASLVFHDVFRTARYNNYRISPTLHSTTHVRPRYPNIMLSLSYAFNSKTKEHGGGKVSSGAAFEGKDF